MRSTLMNEEKQRVSISNRIERLPSSSSLKKVASIIIIAAFVEAIDVSGMSFMLPVLREVWGLDPATLGYLASISFVGMFLGSLLSGTLADKFGRKPVIIVSMLVWGLASFLFAFSWSVSSMFVFRFLFGLGAGAQVPIGASMISEMVPSRLRGKYIAAFQAILPLGMAFAGLITYLTLPAFGWKGVFIFQGLLALWVFVVWKFLPESSLWLESKGRYAEADKIMSQMEDRTVKETGQPLPPIEAVPAIEQEKKSEKMKVSFTELFKGTYRKTMIMAMIWFFTQMMGFYGLNLWLSSLLVEKGFGLTTSIGYIATIALGGLPAYFLISYLVEKIGRKWTVVSMALLTAVTAFIYGGASTFALVILTGLLYQFIQYGYNSVVLIYTPELFSTSLRGRGTGIVMATGRIGATLGPIIIGYLMATYGGSVVILFAVLLNIIGATVVALLGPETKGKVF